MKKTIVINLMGGPGAGKSTFATMLFASLKKQGISCEYVDEFAKGLVWEEHHFALEDQLYILANQNYNLSKVLGKVNVIITDSPLLLSMFYNGIKKEKKYNIQYFDNLVLDCYNKYDNIVYYLERNFPYEKEGRIQTEEESSKINNEILNMLRDKKIPYKKIESTEKYANEVSDFIISLLKIYNSKKTKEHEFERRFLLKNDDILKLGLTYNNILQTYLTIGQTEKRIRMIDANKYYYTEKSGEGTIREEFETQITKQEYDYFLKNFKKGKSINKNRYTITIEGAKKCEINSFVEPIKLNLVEVEFEDEIQMEKFTPPIWFGEEVTLDKEYNSYQIAMK